MRFANYSILGFFFVFLHIVQTLLELVLYIEVMKKCYYSDVEDVTV